MNFTKKTLQNGLTIISVPMKDSLSVTVLVMVHAGSKYETKEINGLSHFLEHMCFKGTVKRPTSFSISRELDGIGSQHNAFTSQEFTGYYAKAHPDHAEKILDVVSDIYLNPVFDEKEIEKEKGVIIEEINMYEDMPQMNVHDVFMKALYGDQPAGWGVAGEKEVVSRMTRNDFIEYRNKHYVASATTVIVSGNFDESVLLPKIEKSFEQISAEKKADKKPIIESQSAPIVEIKKKETDQTHIVIGLRAYDAKNKKNTALKLLNSILGAGMSSRLFQKLREEMGVGYYVRSGVDEYTDHGVLAVSTGVDVNRVPEVVSAVLSELFRFTKEIVSPEELNKAKEYIVGNMYLGLESSDSIAEYYAIQDILSDEILTPAKLVEKIRNVTSADIMEVAQEIVRNDRLAMAIVGNIKNESELREMFHF